MLPTPSEPLELLHEKTAGRSCRRRAKPDLQNRDRRRCHGNGLPRTGNPARRRACRFSTDLRPRCELRPKAKPGHRRGHSRRLAKRQRHAATPVTGRQVLLRTTWPSAPTTWATATGRGSPKPSAPGDLPWEGRSRPRTRDDPIKPRKRSIAGNANSTLSRTRAKGDATWRPGQPRPLPAGEILVNDSVGHAHFMRFYPQNCPQCPLR